MVSGIVVCNDLYGSGHISAGPLLLWMVYFASLKAHLKTCLR